MFINALKGFLHPFSSLQRPSLTVWPILFGLTLALAGAGYGAEPWLQPQMGAPSTGNAVAALAGEQARPRFVFPGQGDHGRYTVQVFAAGEWRDAGAISLGKHFVTKSLDLTGLPAEGRVRLRIGQSGGGAAHIDHVSLNGAPPISVAGAPLKKLARKDFDVSDAFGKTIEVEFAQPGGPADGTARFTLTARVEAEVISKTPFLFPTENTYRPMTEAASFYRYRVGARRGTLRVDGDTAGERLGKPFFSGNMTVGSGHPQGTTYGWVRDDGRNLYVAIDFTSDNTMDGGKDYAAVFVKTAAGLKEFKVSTLEQTWGRAGFVYTDKVVWQHKVYEFAIPLSQIGNPKAGTELV